ncbi:WYL domain-containing protein [Aeromicrobium sp.]|uniref:WYL domain-containing protein n=1 Tax=Aeromicrobium sp. TaxID=1871063 RepID=UPI003458BFB3
MGVRRATDRLGDAHGRRLGRPPRSHTEFLLPRPRRPPPPSKRRRFCGAASSRASPRGHLGRPLVLVAYRPDTKAWAIYSLDRIHALSPTGTAFERRELPDPDVARYVTITHDRGDTAADWPCLGTVLMDLTPEVVAEWAPGGSVVEYVTPTQARFTLGAWSWAGVVGLLATFDADFTVIEPRELKRRLPLPRRALPTGRPVRTDTTQASGRALTWPAPLREPRTAASVGLVDAVRGHRPSP